MLDFHRFNSVCSSTNKVLTNRYKNTVLTKTDLKDRTAGEFLAGKVKSLSVFTSEDMVRRLQ